MSIHVIFERFTQDLIKYKNTNNQACTVQILYMQLAIEHDICTLIILTATFI